MPSSRGCFPLQRISQPLAPAVQPLYYRDQVGLVTEQNDWDVYDGGASRSFDTYFNSFYESYWLENTDIQDLYLEFQLSGCLLIEIYRETADGEQRLVAAERIRQSGGLRRVTVPLYERGQLGSAGRLFFRLTAMSESRIKDVAFCSTTPPATDSSFTLGICTFNRETFLRRTLQAISDAGDRLPMLRQVIVVNQGRPFSDSRLLDLLADKSRHALVEQRNFGGCGGFTRSMYEALQVHDASHHVLMDDDTTLDPQILSNLALFLGYVSRDIVVGGHMLDMLKPCTLYEAGAMVRGDARIQPLQHNIDLQKQNALKDFCSARTVDYNAWWLCALPRKHMIEAEFPAPIFIRGDDVEYGVRLRARGVPTAAMPGIAVWHEPFYAKADGWQLYYDLRNRLILAAVYPERFSLERPKRVLWAMMRALAVHDYGTVDLLVRAVWDFLRGPTLLDDDAEKLHLEIISLAKCKAPPPVQGALPKPGKNTLSEWKGEWQIALGLGAAIAKLLLAPLGTRPRELLLDSDAHPRNVGRDAYVRTNASGSYHRLYKPDRRLLVRGLGQSFQAVLMYKSRGSGVAAEWHARIGAFRSRDWWSDLFRPEQA